MALSGDQLKHAIKFGVPDAVLTRASPKAMRWYAKAMTWYTCGRHYETPINPTEIIKIDPTTVTSRMTNESKSYFEHSDMICEVVDGDWDTKVKQLESYDLYVAFQDRFLDGVPWKSTDFYTNRVESISAGKTKWGCSTIEQFNERLAALDDLYNNIKTEGYTTQAEIRNKSVDKPVHNRSNEYLYPEFHEVIVNVARDGEFILHDGRHRFSIAQILGIERLPVRIKARHKHWQQTRENAKSSSKIREEFSEHPDITV